VSTRVVIADDHAVFRAGLRAVLEAQPDVECVADVGDGPAALEAVRATAPDVAVLDVRMPGLDGLAVARELRRTGPAGLGIVLLTTFDTDDNVRTALAHGVDAFALKSLPPDELVGAVRAAARGGTYLDPSITRRLVPHLTSALTTERARRERAPGLHALTAREHEVFRLVAAGLTNSEIGERLFVGAQTVKTHVSHVLTKLGLRDRVHVVRFAHRHGLADDGDIDSDPDTERP